MRGEPTALSGAILVALLLGAGVASIPARASDSAAVDPEVGRPPAPPPLHNGDFAVSIIDSSGAPVHHALSPAGRQLLLEARRQLHAIEREQAEVQRVRVWADQQDPDVQACAERARREVDRFRDAGSQAYAGVRENVFRGRIRAARNHFAVISVLRTRAAVASARAPGCLARRYQHEGRTRVTVREGVPRAPVQRTFWDRRIPAQRGSPPPSR